MTRRPGRAWHGSGPRSRCAKGCATRSRPAKPPVGAEPKMRSPCRGTRVGGRAGRVRHVALTKRAGKGSDIAVSNARAAWTSAQENLHRQRDSCASVETEYETPLPTPSEGQLDVARSDLRASVAELAKIDRSRADRKHGAAGQRQGRRTGRAVVSRSR